MPAEDEIRRNHNKYYGLFVSRLYYGNNKNTFTSFIHYFTRNSYSHLLATLLDFLAHN